ncbi:hypothetical protein Sango_0831400 [Sesamum angolense]|uniref:DnaJ/Hsp40 cysteine-rich domain superfamily protein n=1 Tax=Sesamum angolense TaxID=2727404 RepID=A0AAE2C0L0_9LAMI|nr:hypothetical protein Sango_0831400 [Sesamum angolense]
MESALKIGPSSICSPPKISPSHCHLPKNSSFLPRIGYANRWSDAGSLSSSCSSTLGQYSMILQAVPCTAEDSHRRRSSLESLFCYDKPIPEEIIEKPIGLSLAEKDVGENPRCQSCQTKGATLCATCSGSGLYVDSILESQGIIVKVRCLGMICFSNIVLLVSVVGELGILCVPNVVAGVTFDLAGIQVTGNGIPAKGLFLCKDRNQVVLGINGEVL